MKYFPAVIDKETIRVAKISAPRTFLASYHYFKNTPKLIKDNLNQGVDIFIDSGAFSAKHSGAEINIDKYCQFIKDTGVRIYAALDDIDSAQKSYDNLIYMQKQGLNPVPVFHMGETTYDLDRLLEFNYIALGGLMGSNVKNHLDLTWSIILNKKPNLKVHGFAVTGPTTMKRYPWYSVDSSSFQSLKRFGRQTYLENGLTFNTINEKSFLDFLETLGYNREWLLCNNKERRFLYDLHSLNSYKIFAAHLKELNKIKDFSYLTDQLSLF